MELKTVKISNGKESFWVKDLIRYSTFELSGTVYNKLIDPNGMKFGDIIYFRLNDILDWWLEDEKMSWFEYKEKQIANIEDKFKDLKFALFETIEKSKNYKETEGLSIQ